MVDIVCIKLPTQIGLVLLRTLGRWHKRQLNLVILLGDGVNQYMNHRRAGLALHAPVHAFRMPRGLPAGLHRVWYGLSGQLCYTPPPR